LVGSFSLAAPPPGSLDECVQLPRCLLQSLTGAMEFGAVPVGIAVAAIHFVGNITQRLIYLILKEENFF
jgi:hypothetical protein